MPERNGARIPFFLAGYLGQLESWGERIARICVCLLLPQRKVCGRIPSYNNLHRTYTMEEFKLFVKSQGEEPEMKQ